MSSIDPSASAPGLRAGEAFWPAPAHERAATLHALSERPQWQETPGLWASFGSLEDLLHAAHNHWMHALAGAVDVAIEIGDGDLSDDVRSAYDTLQARMPGLRRLLDEHTDHPALTAAHVNERRLIATAAAVTDPTPLMRGSTAMRVPEQGRRALSWLPRWIQ